MDTDKPDTSVTSVHADDVRRAVELAVDALRGTEPEAWEAKAGTLDWTCRETLEHLADDLFTYASRFGLRHPPTATTMPFRTSSERNGGPANVLFVDRSSGTEGLLTALESCGGLFASILRSAPPTAVAYHVFGNSDAEGFAAMGVVETLVHTHDITQGLNREWSPPGDLCERVLKRLFPHVEPEGDAWQTLLWATGRAALPGRPQLNEWRWYGS